MSSKVVVECENKNCQNFTRFHTAHRVKVRSADGTPDKLIYLCPSCYKRAGYNKKKR